VYPYNALLYLWLHSAGCPINYYGDNCTMSCPVTCVSPVCNPDNGSCIGGCVAGFKGVQCNEGCSLNFTAYCYELIVISKRGFSFYITNKSFCLKKQTFEMNWIGHTWWKLFENHAACTSLDIYVLVIN
jgi:hypothetical protein